MKRKYFFFIEIFVLEEKGGGKRRRAEKRRTKARSGNIISNILDQSVPIMRNIVNLPTKVLGSFDVFSHGSTKVHELLGDTSDIQAGTYEG